MKRTVANDQERRQQIDRDLQDIRNPLIRDHIINIQTGGHPTMGWYREDLTNAKCCCPLVAAALLIYFGSHYVGPAVIEYFKDKDL